MTNTRILSTLTCLVLFAFACGAQGTGRQNANVNFVLDGKVARIDTASNGQQTALVEVESSPKTPKAVGNLEHQTVEVKLRSTSKDLKEGESYTFYGTGLAAGDRVRIREVSHSDSSAPGFAAVSMQPDVSSRFTQADLLITGKVAKVVENALELSANAPPSEHDPKYEKLVIHILKVLRGHTQKTVIEALVPTSQDIAYIGTTDAERNLSKLTDGDQKIFALRWNEQLKSYTASETTDVQPVTELPKIMYALGEAFPSSSRNTTPMSQAQRVTEASNEEMAVKRSVSKKRGKTSATSSSAASQTNPK